MQTLRHHNNSHIMQNLLDAILNKVTAINAVGGILLFISESLIILFAMRELIGFYQSLVASISFTALAIYNVYKAWPIIKKGWVLFLPKWRKFKYCLKTFFKCG